MKTELMWAIDRFDVALARNLVRDGASVDAVDENGQTPLHLLCQQERWYITMHRDDEVDDLLLELLAAGADVNAADLFGNTPLHFAVTHQTTLLAEVLVSAGADIQHQNIVGETPLTVARVCKHPKTVAFLRERMAHGDHVSDETELLPISVFVNAVNGEAITTTRSKTLAKWQCSDGRPESIMSSEADYLDPIIVGDNLNIAIPPQGDTFLIAPVCGESISVCRWSDMTFSAKFDCPEEEITSFAVSPDGRWLAVGLIESRILQSLFLVNRDDHEIVSKVWSGEAVVATEFDETSSYISTICRTGGDLYIRTYRIEPDGKFTQVCKEMPHDWGNHLVPFDGRLSSVAVNGEQNLIAVFVTWTTSYSQYPAKWRATCGVCDLQSGKRFWIRSFDSDVTGDARSFLEASSPHRIRGNLLFLNPHEIVCNVSYDSLIVLDALTGEETRRIPLGHNHGVGSFALDRQRNRLWTVSAQSELHVYDV